MRLNLGRSIRRVSIVKADGSGVVVLHRGKKSRKKRKKQSWELKPMERGVRRLSDANLAASKTYSKRHRRSNRKKRDGWARDLPDNVMRASWKGAKKL
jgi:hypothetical protein